MAGKALAAVCAALAAALLVAPSAPGLTKPEVLSILELPEGFTPLTPSLDFAQLKPGDGFAFVQGLYSWRGSKRGTRIGHIDGSCQIVSAVSRTGAGKAHCVANAFLPAGQILFGGYQPFAAGPGKFTYPIIGGTGHYANARGWVAIHDIGTSGKTGDVFHLVP
jgi:hypothetical protein